jgi:eukaryotic-like serine/threonine-protein kinase
MSEYRVIEQIGRGGFGVVHKVEDEDGILLARKTFEPAPHMVLTNAERKKLRARFKREVRTQELLGGNEILPVLDTSLDGDSPWFVMPLAEKSYETQITEDRATGSVDIDALADVLNALEYLHDHGYVHRDLNPKNILLHDGQWKLADLGAVLPPTDVTVRLTEDTVIYTEQYCAPEQRRNFHSAQPSADIYSFGCILHDIFGTAQRIPYSKAIAEGAIGIVIGKCTEVNPRSRPPIRALKGMVLEELIELGGECRVTDERSGEWLSKLEDIEDWGDDEYDEFARFFAQLDIDEREAGHEREWVYSLSTPFLTRLPSDALVKIVKRKDGVSGAIVEKYCEWVRSTQFLFHFADTVCNRLTAIYRYGGPAIKAQIIAALICLGETHNRWHVMRCALRRCSDDDITPALAKRFEIEIKTEELEGEFARCVDEVEWDVDRLPTNLAKLCDV